MSSYDEEKNILKKFPKEIVERILFYLYVRSEKKFKNILSVLYTEKYFYRNFLYMIYTLKPIVVALQDSSEHISSDHSGVISLEIFTKYNLWNKIRVLNITHYTKFRLLDSIWRHKKKKIISSDKNCITSDREKIRKDSMAFFSQNLNNFCCLTSLTIKTNNFSFLYIFCSEIPQTLIKMSIIIDNYSLANLNNFFAKNPECARKIITGIKSTTFNLEYFLISSTKPIMQSKIQSFFCINLKMNLNFINEDLRSNFFSHDENFVSCYYKSRCVNHYEYFNYKKKYYLIIFGYLIYKLLSQNKISLKSIEMENFDLALIFNKSFKKNYSYLFPNLRFFFFDSTSLNKLSTWFHDFEIKNSYRKNNGSFSLIIAIHNSLQNNLLTTTSDFFSTRAQNKVWIALKNPKESVERLKADLNLQF